MPSASLAQSHLHGLVSPIQSPSRSAHAPPAMSIYLHLVPVQRAATKRLKAVGRCIYCLSGQEAAVDLTDEHVVPDGLGGDLVLPQSSCRSCAKATSRAETHLITEVLQFPRSIAEVRSRKRKPKPRTAKVLLDGTSQEVEIVITPAAPFMFAFPTTSGLPGILSGFLPGIGPSAHVSVFGRRDWNERGRAWLGGNGTFRVPTRMHLGIVGQALAKMAHAFASAQLGVDAFDPFLTEYIRATEPAFDSHHIGIHESLGEPYQVLHYFDVQVTRVRRVTAAGISFDEEVYVVFMRLFANQASPTILVVVGRPRALLAPFITTFDPTVRA
jgi:hypothetical protein